MTPTARRSLALPLLFAAAKLLLHLPFLRRFGIHHDELYFLACGRHLDLGYVDHAPFVPWVARLVEELFGAGLDGPGLVALRLPAVLAGAAALGLAVWLAERLGGGRFAQVAVGLSMLAAPVYVRATAMLTIPAFEPLVWVAVGHLLLTIVRHDRPRLWLAVGAVCGLGLWIKHSTLFLGFGLAVALVATSHRRHLRSKWLWAGGAVAFLIFLPHLAWQAMHGWPTAAFLANLNAEVMSGVHPLQFVFGQVLYLNPVTAPLWIAGLWVGLGPGLGRTRGPADDPRSLYAWIWLGVFLLLLLLGSKIYYLAPAYPTLLAAGAVRIESWCRRGAESDVRALRPLRAGGLLAFLVAGGLWMAPLNLPILSLERTEAYIDAITFGAFDNAYELTADLRGQFGWEERVDAVADVWHGLPGDERDRAVILGEWYGPAGAVDLYGPARGLPSAWSTHLGYHLWGPPPAGADVYVMAGHDPEDLEAYFGDVRVLRRLELERVNPWHTPFVISVAREPKTDVAEAWPALRSY